MHLDSFVIVKTCFMSYSVIHLEKVPRKCVSCSYGCLSSLCDARYSLMLKFLSFFLFLKIQFRYIKLCVYVHVSVCGSVHLSAVVLRS